LIWKRRKVLIAPCEIAEFPVRLLNHVVIQPLPFLASPSHTENDSLLAGDGLRLGEAIDCLVPELRSQNIAALVDAVIGNDHYEHASRPHPSSGMVEKQLFHPLVLPLADFEVVGRIEVQQRKGFYGSVCVEDAPLDYFVQHAPSLIGAIRVEFDAISSH
jgi:hypothetical protein